MPRPVLDDRVADPLHANRERIEISQVFMERLGFKILVEVGIIGCSG